MESSSWACTSMTQCMLWSICLANNYIYIHIIPKFSHSYLLLSCFHLFLPPRLENCLVDFGLELSSSLLWLSHGLQATRARPALSNLSSLTWSVACSWLCIDSFFCYLVIRPSRWSFPLGATSRRLSSSSSCNSSLPLIGPAKHEGLIISKPCNPLGHVPAL